MITKYISDLLFYHECVIVPGLGGFIKASHSALLIQENGELFPPHSKVAFNASLSVNDGQLATYISGVEKKSYRDALAEIRLWVELNVAALKQGNRVKLNGIGDLFTNSSGNIEFIPEQDVNFNSDSFGLPILNVEKALKPSLKSSDTLSSEIPVKRFKNSRLIPETLKWAAVLAPFVAFVLWGSLNGNVVSGLVKNYTGIGSILLSAPDEKVVNQASDNTFNQVVAEETESPASILEANNIDFEPAKIAHELLSAEKPEDKKPEILVPAEKVYEFHIVGGAFRDYSNALKFVENMKLQGYSAQIADTTSGGLFIVSIKGCSSKEEATSQLKILQAEGFSSSWILKKNNI